MVDHHHQIRTEANEKKIKWQKKRMEDNLRVKDAHEIPPFTIQISTSASIFMPFNCFKHPNVLIMMQTPATSPIFDNWQAARMIPFVGADSIWSWVITPTMQLAHDAGSIWRYGMMRRSWCGWYESYLGQLNQITSRWYLPKLQMPSKLDYHQTP